MNILYKYPRVFIMSLFVLSSVACKQKVIDNNEKLHGDWQILEAYRNGRKTVTLEKVYFKFWNGDSIQTNFTGDEISAEYYIKDDSIVIKQKYPSFKVLYLNDDTLNLKTTIMGKNFTLIMLNTKNRNK